MVAATLGQASIYHAVQAVEQLAFTKGVGCIGTFSAGA
jgi:hypothetical protein